MHAIRKGQVRWAAKDDVVAQRQFIHTMFGIAAQSPRACTAARPRSRYLQQNQGIRTARFALSPARSTPARRESERTSSRTGRRGLCVPAAIPL